MGVVTATIDDEVEERFREKLEKIGDEKGLMGEKITEAIDEWLKNETDKSEWKEIMKEGLELGGESFDRIEANER